MKFNKYLVESEERILRWGPQVWKELKKKCMPFIKEFRKTGLAGKRKVITKTTSQFWIWRGADRGISSTPGYKEIKPRGNRRPKDMPEGLHNKFDDEFHNKFGWRARSEGVFTTSAKRTAASYGKPYIFFPVGHYEYIWSDDIHDLYSTADSENLLGYNDAYYDDWTGGVELEDEFQENYGEGSGSGHWEYQGEEVCDYRCTRSDVFDEMAEREGKDFVPNYIEWVPEITFEEFIDQKNEEDRDRMDNEIDNIINSYTDKDLKGAIKSTGEIMFNCKSYYLVHESYEDFLYGMLSSGQYQYKLPFPHDYLDLMPGKPKLWMKTKGGNLVHSG